MKGKPWVIRHGKWWMVQWHFGGWISFGIHIDPIKRRTGRSGIRYGPYMDVHILWMILSIGFNPYYSTDGSD
jgi:hypothetical protein